MLKKTMTYTNFNDIEVTEDFYFNLSKAEIMEMELSPDGGSFKAHMERIVNAKDNAALVAEFKKLILMSYGRKSDDGKLFLKSDTIRAEFECHPAFSDLFMELAMDTDAAFAFVSQVIPKDLAGEVDKKALTEAYIEKTTSKSVPTPPQTPPAV